MQIGRSGLTVNQLYHTGGSNPSLPTNTVLREEGNDMNRSVKIRDLRFANCEF